MNDQEKQEKKHNKLVGWFLALPKWGKILLIAGSAVAVASSITFPVLAANGVFSGGKSGGVQVTEAEFKSAIDYLNGAHVGNDHDNRNLEGKLKGTCTCYQKDAEKPGEEEVLSYEVDLTYKYEQDYLNGDGSMNFMGIQSSVIQKSHYLGDGTYYLISSMGGEEDIELQDTGDVLSMLGSAKYDYNSLDFKNGTYSGNFTYSFVGESTPCNIPTSIIFDNNKRINSVKVSGKDIPYEEEPKTSNTPYCYKIDIDLSLSLSNYGNTTTSLSDKDFPLYEINYPNKTEITIDDADFKKCQIIVLKSNDDSIKTKTLILETTTSSSVEICFSSIMCNGEELEDTHGEKKINLNAYSEKIKKNTLYIQTEGAEEWTTGSVTLKISNYINNLYKRDINPECCIKT